MTAREAAKPAFFPVLDGQATQTLPVLWLDHGAPKIKRVHFGAERIEMTDEPESPAPNAPRPASQEQGFGETSADISLGEAARFGAVDDHDGLDGLDDGPAPSASYAQHPAFGASDAFDGGELPPSLSIPPPSLGEVPVGVLDDVGSYSSPPPPLDMSREPAVRELPPEAVAAFARAAIELAAARQTALAEVEHQLLELSVSIASVIIEREIETHPDLHGKLARAALSALTTSGTPTLRASRESYGAILDVFGEPFVELDGAKVRVELDPSLEGLGVVAETAHVRVDGRVTERLRMVLRAMEDERRRAMLEGSE
jgi:hypothetical protein